VGETLEQFADRVAAATPAPAGGSVAAVTAGLAAALVAMIGRVTAARPKGAEPEAVRQLIEQADHLRRRLLDLAEEDARAYSGVLSARRNLEGGEAERDVRLAAAWSRAAHIPAEVVRLCREVAQLARRAADTGPATTLGDAVMAALLAAAAAAGSMVNLRLNVEAAGAPVKLRLLVDDTTIVLREAQKAAMETRALVERRGAAGAGPVSG